MKPTDGALGSRRRELFLKALETRDPAERRAFLDAQCAQSDADAALRASVEELLAHHHEDGFLEESPAGRVFAIEDPARAPEPPGEEMMSARIGRYKLLQKIGEGGCGVVYMAEQEEPVRRRVALKVIKLGMDTRSVIARFEAERQALAMMDHPNIAKVLEAGATEAGRPYFVMELVRGVRITEHCDQHHLATRDRLELFSEVCQAIQHLHQKGIIHRDIKPSNILVTLHDGIAVPKVIDFGIAKATTDQRLTDKTLFTALDQFVGTPAYMSPEQAEMSGLDIDTRSDIYSLGVLLYEILTGKTPFDSQELASQGLDAMRRTIREQEPVQPSTRLSAMLEAELTTTAKNRQSEPMNLIHLLRRDVDWIVMKCLEKDRARRYETANGLASDIQRHLNNEAVLARPPNAAYRFQKLVWRNKLAFCAAATVFAVLLLGVATTIWQAVRATRAGANEAVQRRLAETQRNAAVEQRKLADMELALQAWEEGDIERAQGLIELSRPAPGHPHGFEWRFLKKLCQDQSIETFGRPGHTYRSVQFFARDSLLFNDTNTLTVQDLARRHEQLLLEDRDGISRPTFCPENTNVLATVTDQSRIKIWDAAARRLRVELEGHPHFPITALAFSPDGQWLASASQDKTVKLWHLPSNGPATGRTVYQYPSWAFSVLFAHDGSQLFSSGIDTVIRTWDAATGSEVGKPFEGHTDSIYGLALSPDGQRLASGGTEHIIFIWDVNSRQRITRLFGHSGGIRALSFSPDGTMLASGGYDQMIRLWDLSNEKPTALFRGHHDQVTWLSLSADGELLLSQGQSGLIKLWRVTPGLEGNVLTDRAGGQSDVALSPDGRFLASVTEQVHAVNLWDLNTRSRTILTGHSNSVMSAAFSPDGKILATGSHDETIKLWDVSDRKEAATLTNGFPVGSLAFAPDGRTLIAGGSPLHILVQDRAGLQFWDVPSRRATGTIAGDASDIVKIALSGDGILLATAHRKVGVSLWDAQTRRLLKRFDSDGEVMSLAFSPTEPLLAAGDWDGDIVFFNTSTLAKLGTSLKAHTFGANGLAFSPDGQTLASYGDGGGGVKLWNVATRRMALTLKGHLAWVSGIAFSRDGNLMASSSMDSTVRLWPAATLEEALEPDQRERAE